MSRDLKDRLLAAAALVAGASIFDVAVVLLKLEDPGTAAVTAIGLGIGAVASAFATPRIQAWSARRYLRRRSPR